MIYKPFDIVMNSTDDTAYSSDGGNSIKTSSGLSPPPYEEVQCWTNQNEEQLQRITLERQIKENELEQRFRRDEMDRQSGLESRIRPGGSGQQIRQNELDQEQYKDCCQRVFYVIILFVLGGLFGWGFTGYIGSHDLRGMCSGSLEYYIVVVSITICSIAWSYMFVIIDEKYVKKLYSKFKEPMHLYLILTIIIIIVQLLLHLIGTATLAIFTDPFFFVICWHSMYLGICVVSCMALAIGTIIYIIYCLIYYCDWNRYTT
jgi:hypothetical protein